MYSIKNVQQHTIYCIQCAGAHCKPYTECTLTLYTKKQRAAEHCILYTVDCSQPWTLNSLHKQTIYYIVYKSTLYTTNCVKQHNI